ncbi:MAG TPA: hypothetical protein VJL88_08790 [Nitrospira sp.]|nr:hypothetical protein [Nitrospira sp.]
MSPLFVDSQSAFLFTGLLLIGHPETVDIWTRDAIEYAGKCRIEATA